MKKFKSYIAIVIAITMFNATLLPTIALAHTTTLTGYSSTQKNNFIANKDIVYIEDEGDIIPVEITETTSSNSNNDISLRSFWAEAKVGTKKNYTIKLSNASLGYPSGVANALGKAAKTKIARTASKAIIKKVGASFIPGVNLISWILTIVASINAYTGKNGIAITIKLVYKSSYRHKDGYYLYGWSPTGLSISRY